MWCTGLMYEDIKIKRGTILTLGLTLGNMTGEEGETNEYWGAEEEEEEGAVSIIISTPSSSCVD